MFEIGECIVYGINGICRVEGIVPSPYDRTDTREYYFLVPIGSATSSIYTPVDNDRVPMRRLMTREEIDSLMQRIPDIEPLAVPVERQRRELYRTTIGSLEPDGYVRVIKAVDQRRVRLAAARKHFPMTDLEYGRLARRLLYGECAHVLGVSEQEAEAYVLGKEA